MATTRIKVTRAFFLGGQPLEVGAEADVSEALAIELVSYGKAEYAQAQVDAAASADAVTKPPVKTARKKEAGQ